MKALLTLVLALSVSLTSLAPVAQAQTSELSATQSATISQATLEQELNTLRNTYRGQLAEYREAEKSYQISAQQYAQLNTLVSLEAALQSMKQAMVLRDQVLLTYLTILNVQLKASTGINLDQKTSLETSLASQIDLLNAHFQTAQAAESREQIVGVADSFEELGESTEEVAYAVQTTLVIGRLQTVYDKATIFANELDRDLVSGGTDIKQSERQRAMAEIRSALQRAKAGIDEMLESRRTASQNSFQSALRDLNQIYGDLSQVLDYLDELMRL